MEQTYAIELKNITKRFGKIVANDGINLKVKRGEILSLLGENGSGKTTLMNMISGIYFPDEGHILVDGKAVSIRSPKDSFDLGIGMIHQHFKLIDVMTAAENIILGLKGNAVLDMKKVHKDIQELVDRYGFDLDPAQKVYTMSVSQKQTVEIHDPEDVKGSDVIYTDIWVSMGESEELYPVRVKALSPYKVTTKMMKDTGNDKCLFMHCLPSYHDFETSVAKDMRDRLGLDIREVEDEVFRSENSVVFDEAENRMHTIKAVMVATLGR